MYRRPAARAGISGTIDVALDLQRRAWGAARATPGLAVLSLILGFAFWVAVTDIENPTRIEVFPAAVPVEAVNLDPSLALTSTLQRVQVTVSAPDNRWQRLTSENLRAYVDLSAADPREQLVPVQVDVRGIAGVTVTRVSPPSLLVAVEPVTSKRVPVVPGYRGSPPLGYEVTSTTPSQSSVLVSGPSSLVARVEEAAAEINVAGLTVELVDTATLVAHGEGGIEVKNVRMDPESVRVQVKIVQSTLRRQVPLQPTYAGEPANGYRVASVVSVPSAATLEGSIEALQGLDSWVLPAVDVAGANQPIQKTIRVTPPKGVATPAALDVSVTIDIQPIVGTARFAVPITLSGGPPSARLSTAATFVTLAGSLPALNDLAPADVKARVEMTAVTPGTYQLTVRVDAPPNTRVVLVQPDTVSVTIPGP
ncbi:MAG: CdaR family protein [Dehalococcoidia bacterium]